MGDPGQPSIVYQNAEVATLGQRANSIVRGSQNMDLPLEQFLLNVHTELGDHVYQKLMRFCAELHTLGVIAGVIDGPTEEYRAAIKSALQSYFTNLLARSQRTSWWENLSPLDAASTGLGYWYKLFGAGAGVVGAEGVARDWHTIGDNLIKTDPEKFVGNLVGDFISSLWEDCKKRWHEFWRDFEQKGLLVAAGKLYIDAAIVAAEIGVTVAISVATAGAAGVALQAIKIVGRRVSATATEIVVRVVNKASHAVPDAARVLGPRTLPDADIDRRIIREVFDEDKLGTGADRGDLAKRGEQPNDPVNQPQGGQSANTQNKTDVRPDGSYRDPADPAGIRRNASGEAMVQDPKTGTWENVSGSSNNLKGKFGETMADRYMESQGYQKVNGPNAQMTTPGHNGIDGVYSHPGPPPRYVIADAKYGTAGLGTLKDGTQQMSPSWVRGRLEDAVGEDLAFDINRGGYEPIILRVDKDGKVVEESLKGVKWRDADK